ncbi:Cytoskeleton protein RodZ [Paraburkholderia domus]|uniref:Cytoskeleton protein RodZ n=1 Tax=Paraburkholderia domus TaxID=2793075 RepID=A0A9N8R0J8_9BURK|nr:RodZ domain-containing protein [Paraburkholderia domus]MBK5048675.1 helix-turn-helix domain-containing protein [Burkholderia sp. R-70006]MBK5060736.1 helix-turn-helix domain-containing protein [Burkholderia sp. R-70199]MBK5085749.1 helix-turn-helix domain-containing protein [Burkholderia sp. R-69927]MBK5120668.1 helix-turn-helix domain-containing protein [Burkholderia sp. R-69980]MBK5165935.1 helix-turn-helix domain-containing protein [Burkholderia sp. R-70211]
MSEPQHPQPQDADTNEGHPAPATRAVVQPVVPPGLAGLDSLAAVGARLTQLRESKGWTIEDVSARLKVSVTKLRALESGDISHLPDTTFALGVVRSYAKMLGADPTPFTQALRREKGVPAPDLSMPASSGRDLPRGRVSLSLGGSGQKSRSWLWGIAAVIVAVIALGMWHTNGGDSSAWLARLKASANGAAGGATGASGAVAQGQPAGSEATADEAASAPETQAAADNTASATPMPAPLATGTEPSSAPAVTAAAVAPKAGSQVQAAAQGASVPVVAAIGAPGADTATAAPVAGEAIVALRVTQDSWFSVRGKDGKEVFSGLVHAGDTKEVTGAAPFKVTIGNKAGLESLTLDGQPVDPSKYSATMGNVARFALP